MKSREIEREPVAEEDDTPTMTVTVFELASLTGLMYMSGVLDGMGTHMLADAKQQEIGKYFASGLMTVGLGTDTDALKQFMVVQGRIFDELTKGDPVMRARMRHSTAPGGRKDH